MIKHQIFVNKHAPVQTPRNKQRRMFDLFKLINKDTTVIKYYFSVVVIIFRHDITFHLGVFTVYSTC